MKLHEIGIRDPFLLVDHGKYYLYGTRAHQTWGKAENCGFDVYVSTDCENWSEPIEIFRRPEGFWGEYQYWAPEVHLYRGRYYLFASFKSDDQCRGTQVLVSDTPDGVFTVHSSQPLTPMDWECLDGTLYVDKSGIPYLVFCHEWIQAENGNGEMCVVRLSEDLKEAVGGVKVLFRGSDPLWSIPHAERYITDGPFLYRSRDGVLFMLWSSTGENGYITAASYSKNGEIDGEWVHLPDVLEIEDGGHGMVFRALDGEDRFICHSPNTSLLERPVIYRLSVQGTELRVFR